MTSQKKSKEFINLSNMKDYESLEMKNMRNLFKDFCTDADVFISKITG